MLPEDKKEARKLVRTVPRFLFQNGVLYRRGFSIPLLRCVETEEAEVILSDIHEGICGNHASGQNLSKRVLKNSYFWPTMKKGFTRILRKCDRCQKFFKIAHAPSNELTPMISPWPFAMWGIDLIEKLPMGGGGCKIVIVAVDYFTKWVEEEPIATITTAKIMSFVTRNIICRYGLPWKIVSDNGTQFESKHFVDFCEHYEIRRSFSLVAHP